jgi:hypothetical protein
MYHELMGLSINEYRVSIICYLRKIDRFKMVRSTCAGVPSVYDMP